MSRSASCWSFCLTNDLKPGASSVDMVIGPGYLTGELSSISATFRSSACSERISLAVVNEEKWSVRSMISWPALLIMSAWKVRCGWSASVLVSDLIGI